MYSDITISLGSSNTFMVPSPATGRHVQRKLANEQIILCAILISVCMPGGAVSRRDQYKWLQAHLYEWAGPVTLLRLALSNITPSTLERYMTLASNAKVITPSGKQSTFSDFVRRNDVALAHSFMSYAEAVTYNPWVAQFVGVIQPADTFCKTIKEKDAVLFSINAAKAVELTDAYYQKLFEEPVPGYSIGVKYFDPKDTRQVEYFTYMSHRPDIVFNNTPVADETREEISFPAPVFTPAKRKWWQKLLGI